MDVRLSSLLLLLVALLASSCGDPDASSGDRTSGTTIEEPGALVHVAGTLRSNGDSFVLTPATGGEPITFSLGPEVEIAKVRAFEAATAKVRVSYRQSDGEPVAASIESAPARAAKLDTYEGRVVTVDASRLVIDGPDGKRTFDISAAKEGAFDAEHLREHAAQGEPIVVHIDPTAPGVGVAYEDA